jgi:preprotein translocase subunit SecB
MSNEAQNQQQFAIQKIYLKDVSFESPNAPVIFTQGQFQPEINVQINTEAKKLADDQHEVTLTVTVTAKQEDKTAFLVEVKQAGLFQMSGFEEEQMGGMLGAYCPEALFPFARETIADLVTKGGFPQVLLAPVNFNALYMQHQQQQQAKQSGETETAH